MNSDEREVDILNTASWTGELIINSTLSIPIQAKEILLDDSDICMHLHHPGTTTELPESYSAIMINWNDAALVSVFVNEEDIVVSRSKDSEILEITLITSRIKSKLTIRLNAETKYLKEIVFRANFIDLKSVCNCRTEYTHF